MVAEVLSSFSILKGWRELTDNSATPAISCLDGIRLLCAFAVLVTHRFLLYYFVPYINFATYLEVYTGCIMKTILLDNTFFIRTYASIRKYPKAVPPPPLFREA